MYNIIQKYLSYFPTERGELEVLLGQMATGENLIDRKNMTGHLTASAMIIRGGKMLLIEHSASGMLLQPGGHVDVDDVSLIAAAQREVREETGLDVVVHPWHAAHGDIPINIDSHPIAPRAEKNEGAHLHHDMLYVFTLASNQQNVTIQTEEVGAAHWVYLHDIDTTNAHLTTAVQKLEEEKMV